MSIPFTPPPVPQRTVAVCWGCGAIATIENGRCRGCTPTDVVPVSACERVIHDVLLDDIDDTLYRDLGGEG